MSIDIVPVCPICGGEVVLKEVEKLIRGGNDVVVVRVLAGVCLKCGERIYDKETQEEFQRLRRELREGRHEKLKQLGFVYEV
jgi:YgiT-type zinc finger domain-containing protein